MHRIEDVFRSLDALEESQAYHVCGLVSKNHQIDSPNAPFEAGTAWFFLCFCIQRARYFKGAAQACVLGTCVAWIVDVLDGVTKRGFEVTGSDLERRDSASPSTRKGRDKAS